MNGAQEKKKPRFYHPELDGLRSLAFFLVFIHHLGSPFGAGVDAYGPFNPLLRLLDNTIRWGWMGVDLFFVLSAYLISTLLLRERKQYGSVKVGSFYFRRLLRIWPLYFLAVGLGFFVLPLVAPGFGPEYGGAVWQRMREQHLIPFVFFFGNMSSVWYSNPPSGMLAPLWSVAIEEQFYIVWGLLFGLCRRIRTLVAGIGILFVLSLVLRAYLLSEGMRHPGVYAHSLSRLDPILLGASLAILQFKFPDAVRRFFSIGLVPLVLAGVILIAVIFSSPKVESADMSLCWVILCIAIALTVLVGGTLYWPALRRIFSWGPLVETGKITYGLYIYHNLCIWFATSILAGIFGLSSGPLWYLIRAGLSLALVWMTAWLSYRFIESSFLMLKDRFARIGH